MRPSHWAYLRACVRLIEVGKAPTQVNLATELHISKQAVWKYLRRWPEVLTFVDAQLREANAHYYGLVQRRMAVLGMQGSVPHAEVFFKSEAGQYARPGVLGDLLPGGGAGVAVQLNILVPRPESRMPPAAGVAVVPSPTPVSSLARPATPSMPTVAVRSGGAARGSTAK